MRNSDLINGPATFELPADDACKIATWIVERGPRFFDSERNCYRRPNRPDIAGAATQNGNKTMKLNRRMALGALLVGAAALQYAVRAVQGRARKASGSRPRGEINLTDAEWRRRLSPRAYQVLRHADTEYPYTSPLNKEHRKGTFSCAGCDLLLYSSDTKFDSGTGWPSFWDHLPNAVRISTDYVVGYPRTEVRCRRCAGHLGHVFDDGPRPTGKRYCMNGVAMKFTQEKV